MRKELQTSEQLIRLTTRAVSRFVTGEMTLLVSGIIPRLAYVEKYSKTGLLTTNSYASNDFSTAVVGHSTRFSNIFRRQKDSSFPTTSFFVEGIETDRTFKFGQLVLSNGSYETRENVPWATEYKFVLVLC
jgi:hypothetical protein